MTTRRSDNVVWSPGHLSPAQRAASLGHGAMTVWLTGLSGSGKSTLAFALEARLLARRVHAYVLDGDNVRHGLNGDLGFSPSDRAENIRRIGHVCRLFNDAGLVVITAFISPYRKDRAWVRELHRDTRFVEVHVSTPLETCEQRDVKGLYARARAGEIPDFSGISAPYEPPESPELAVDTSASSLGDCVEAILALLERHGLRPSPGPTR